MSKRESNKKNNETKEFIVGLLFISFVLYIFFSTNVSKNEDSNSTKTEIKTEKKEAIKAIKKKGEPNTLNGGYPACLTKKDLGDYSLAGMKSDTKMMLYLINNGKCMITKKGTHFDLIDSSIFSGSAKIRIWINDKPVELFTNIENINI